MANIRLKATKDFRYGTRMLRAGETVEMPAPQGRLFLALNAVDPESWEPVKEAAPKAAPKAAAKPRARKRKK